VTKKNEAGGAIRRWVQSWNLLVSNGHPLRLSK